MKRSSKSGNILNFFTKKPKPTVDIDQSGHGDADTTCTTSSEEVKKPDTCKTPNDLLPREEWDIKSDIDDCFKDVTMVHNNKLCREKGCCNISESERDKFKGNRDKFQHKWLGDDVSFCSVTGYWWLLYEEDVGMFCLLCKKHNVLTSGINHYVTGAKRYKRQALEDHAKSLNHRKAITSEMTSRMSVFHKEHQERKHVGEDVQKKAFTAAYWLMKEEIPNTKLTSLLDLIEHVGLESLKYFDHKGKGSLQEIFLLIGDTLKKRIIKEVNDSPSFSILVDEVTDIAVQCQMVVSVQYINKESQAVVKFYGASNVLANSVTADSETLHRVLMECLADLNIDKLGGIVTDGASTMTGKKSGLAARIKREYPKVISVHCICHRLALACTDSNKEIQYIDQTSSILRCLWKFFEDSPKRSATLAKIQLELAKCTTELPRPSRIQVVHKVRKACSTRWLSFSEAVEGCYNDLPAILHCLSTLDKDVMATGLLTKMRNTRFISTIFILKAVLPILARLSKAFQKGTINYSCIEPCIQAAKDALNDLQLDELTEELMTELGEHGRLRALDLTPTQNQLTQMKNWSQKYISALTDNIDQRFEESLPLLTAFAIFDPLLVPDKSDSQFKTYGKTQVQIIAEHFFKEDVESKEEMIAEWSAFKYHLLRMKHDMKNDSGTQNSTSTQSALQRLLQLRVPEGPLFPKFAKVAAVILSLPVSNAWPERGASAIKHIKTRLRNRIKNPMLGSLMQVSINGPDVTEAKNIIDDSVKSWYEVKQRRKIRASDKQTMDSASAQPVVTLADASTQADIPDEQRQQDVEFVRNQMNRVLEVLKLPTISRDECDSAMHDEYDSDDFDYQE